MSDVNLTQKLTNGEVRVRQFENAYVKVNGPFVVVSHDDDREDWFAVGYVMRVEILERESD